MKTTSGLAWTLQSGRGQWILAQRCESTPSRSLEEGYERSGEVWAGTAAQCSLVWTLCIAQDRGSGSEEDEEG
eukprot:6062918-Karenia_brevis.AAC.1